MNEGHISTIAHDSDSVGPLRIVVSICYHLLLRTFTPDVPAGRH